MRYGDEMKQRIVVLWCVIGVVISSVFSAQTVQAVDDVSVGIASWVEGNIDKLMEFYVERHRSPELSLNEEDSAEAVATALRHAGYDVTTGVGGFGVVGVLKNGNGPTVLIRGDMDALPITEETGLPFASTVVAERSDGTAVGVMHACGHDVHMTNLVGTAGALAAAKTHWRGTVVAVGQPAEEIGRGAAAMIEDGFFERFPKPDYCIALHVNGLAPVGSVGLATGWATANVDSVDITIFGRGGHGARPHDSVDPIVIASQVVVALQTLVSRRLDPVEGGVVTVGSFHAGSKHNIIPDQAKLQLTVRSFSDDSRRLLLDGIRDIATLTARAMGSPKDPLVVVAEDQYTPAVYNDPKLAALATRVMGDIVGKNGVQSYPPLTIGEDFGRFPRTAQVPGLLYWLGATDPEVYARAQVTGEALPNIHSSQFAPDADATISHGIRTMSAIALELLAPR